MCSSVYGIAARHCGDCVDALHHYSTIPFRPAQGWKHFGNATHLVPMSSPESTTPRGVDCPRCGELVSVRPVSLLHRNDEAVQQLFTGTLNRSRCSACGAEFLYDGPLLFCDDESGFFVYYAPPGSDQDRAATRREMREMLAGRTTGGSSPDITCRIVFTRRQLIEKVALHRSGLDDRIVEYVKYHLLNGRDEKLDPVRHELLFDFSRDAGAMLAFLVFDRETGKAQASAHLPRELYDELAETFATSAAMQEELNKLFPDQWVSVDTLVS